MYVTLETIKKTFNKCIKLEDDYWKQDGLNVAPIIEPQIIALDQSSSSESESDGD